MNPTVKRSDETASMTSNVIPFPRRPKSASTAQVPVDVQRMNQAFATLIDAIDRQKIAIADWRRQTTNAGVQIDRLLHNADAFPREMQRLDSAVRTLGDHARRLERLMESAEAGRAPCDQANADIRRAAGQ